MEGFGWLLLAFSAAYAGFLAVPLVGWWSRGRLRIGAGWCFGAGVLACPLLIPGDRVLFRAASAFVSTDLVFKMADFLRHHDRVWDGIVVREYLRLVIPFPVLAIVHPDHTRRLARPDRPWPHVLRIVGGGLGVGAGIALLGPLSGMATLRSSPALDHAVKLLVFLLTVESASRVVYGLERLAGYETSPIFRNPFLARTPSAFWRRYNTRMHDWYDRNVFRAAGGRRASARAVGRVFLVSGLHHEWAFGIATSEFTGYQLAFFLLQAPAVLASARLERIARRRGIAGTILAHGLTILFLAVTSVLFFHGASKVFPSIYASRSPLS